MDFMWFVCDVSTCVESSERLDFLLVCKSVFVATQDAKEYEWYDVYKDEGYNCCSVVSLISF